MSFFVGIRMEVFEDVRTYMRTEGSCDLFMGNRLEVVKDLRMCWCALF